jgi:ArsR family transcriptional regulator, arsenate/arsenite/antimonite-responsive transcriptional repressor
VLQNIPYFDYDRIMETKNHLSKPRNVASASSAAQTVKIAVTETFAITALAALAHPQRLRVFRALVQAGLVGLQPSALAAMLDVPSSSLSFHLKELLHAQLLSCEQQGRNLIYRANFAQMTQLLAFLTENCCAADPTPGATACC